MKRTTGLAILCAASLTLLYTACKKNAAKPASTTTANYQAFSSQLATSFYRSITGQYGGTDISKGINSPVSTATSFSTQGHRSIFDTNPLCGYIIDTAYSYVTHTGAPGPLAPGDTIYNHTGHFNFVYNCDGGKVDGYTVNDSVGMQTTFIYWGNNNAVQQKYTVKALDATFKLVSMNGSLTTASSDYDNDYQRSGSLNATYVLSGLTVNFSSGVADITSGT